MKAKPIKAVFGEYPELMRCEHCDEWHSDWTSWDAYWHDEHELVSADTSYMRDGRWYFTEGCGNTTIHVCDHCDCAFDAEEMSVAGSDWWICDNCSQPHETKEEADDCCQS